MVQFCIVAFCKRRGSHPGVHYFRVTSERRNAFLKAIGRDPNDQIGAESAICSDHFLPEDILSTGKLRKGALPILKLRPEKPGFPAHWMTRFQKPPQVENTTDLQVTQYMELVFSDEEASSTLSATESLPEHSYCSNAGKRKLETSPTDPLDLKQSLEKRQRALQLDHSYCRNSEKYGLSSNREKMKALLSTSKKHKSKFQSRQNISKQNIQHLGARVKSLNTLVLHLANKSLITDEAKPVLRKSYDGLPLRIIRSVFDKPENPKHRKFLPELKSFAMTLCFYSTKAYQYVRSTFTNLVLPPIPTVRSWMSSNKCSPGFSQASFDILQEQVCEDKRNGKKTMCCLLLEEMPIKKQIEFVDERTWGYIDLGTSIDHDNLECATEALVLMVVAINRSWKLPIAYYFVNSLSGKTKANILKHALINLAKTGVTVVSVTCDGPNINFEMIRELGADVDDCNELKPYFLYPTTQDMKFIIVDPYHMMNLLRYCWEIYRVFIDENGKEIDFGYIEKLKNVEENRLHFSMKLFKAHHTEWQRHKMKVRQSVQPLCRSVCDALEFLQKKIKHVHFDNAGATIKFMKAINNIFDILNSRSPYGRGSNAALKPSNKNVWRVILNNGLKYLLRLKTKDGHYLHNTPYKTSIQGLAITIKALLGIYDNYVKAKNAPIKYLLTHTFSQSHLELFFCNMRTQNGWKNNPTAFQFYHAYRRFVLQQNLKSIQANYNTTQVDANASPLSSATITTHQHIPNDDVHIIQKYSLEVSEKHLEDSDNSIPNCPPLSLVSENVVAHLARFVLRIVKRTIKCDTCLLSLEDIPETSLRISNVPLLRDVQNNVFLTKPSSDFVAVLFVAEKYLKKVLEINEHLLADASFCHIFSHCLAMHVFGMNKHFIDLADHIFESSLYENNHIMRLIKESIYSYTRVRLHNATKRQTERYSAHFVKNQLSKIILCNQ